jgi:hypothetical protein
MVIVGDRPVNLATSFSLQSRWNENSGPRKMILIIIKVYLKENDWDMGS